MPPSAHARTVDTTLSFRGHQSNAVLPVKISAYSNFEGVKKEGFIKKRNIRMMFSVTNIIIGIDLKFTANKEKCRAILTF